MYVGLQYQLPTKIRVAIGKEDEFNVGLQYQGYGYLPKLGFKKERCRGIQCRVMSQLFFTNSMLKVIINKLYLIPGEYRWKTQYMLFQNRGNNTGKEVANCHSSPDFVFPFLVLTFSSSIAFVPFFSLAPLVRTAVSKKSATQVWNSGL